MRLENTSGSSSKFWAIEVKGQECHVQYGKIGSEGRTSVKAFDSVAAAQAYAKSKTDEKLGGGYVVADGYDGVSRTPAVIPSAPVTAGGVLAARLDIATNAEAVFFDAAEFKSSAQYLKRVGKELEASIESLEAYVPKDPSSPLSRPLDPKTLLDVQGLKQELDALMSAQLKLLDTDAPRGKLAEDDALKLYEFSKALDAVIEKQDLPFALRLDFNGPHATLKQLAKRLRASLPSLKKLKAPPPVLLSASEFAGLSKSEKSALALNAENRGYAFESLHDDDEAEAFVKSIAGQSSVDDMFAYIIERAEEDSDSYEFSCEIGEPSFIEAIAIKSGDEVIAYQFETHINWQPEDRDLIGVHYVDLKGQIFEDDWR